MIITYAYHTNGKKKWAYRWVGAMFNYSLEIDKFLREGHSFDTEEEAEKYLESRGF